MRQTNILAIAVVAFSFGVDVFLNRALGVLGRFLLGTLLGIGFFVFGCFRPRAFRRACERLLRLSARL